MHRSPALVSHWDCEGSLMTDNLAHPYNRRRVLTIDDLPDDDLLAIFDFCVFRYQGLNIREFSYDTKRKIESWRSLVHVCRRWRGLVFGSPRRLNLQLFFSSRKSLDVWPVLPLVVRRNVIRFETSGDDVLAGLKHSDRISQIILDLYTASQSGKFWTAMQVPFPELVVLHLSFSGLALSPVLPDSFLGGSVPRLRYLSLGAIPFPALSNLLSSATHLVYLALHRTPHSGYISPQAMATCLSMLTNLEKLQLEFKSSQSFPDPRSHRPFPPTHFVLPTLKTFRFSGVKDYLEELMALIDAPQLYELSTAFYFHIIDFDTPELNQFISRTPILGAYDEARLIFYNFEAQVRLCPRQPERSGRRVVEAKILCQVSDWQLLFLTQFCTFRLSSHLLTMESLYIYEKLYSLPNWDDDIENTDWLDLLLPFTAVKSLYLSKQLIPCIVPALQELTGARTTDVLPALQNILFEGFQPSEPVQEGIAQFISARQLINHPVTISVWDRDLLLWDEPVDD